MDRRCLLLLGLLPFVPAFAGAATDDDSPDLALLEFLGEWEDSDGEWLDPLQMLETLDAAPSNDRTDTPAATPPAEDTKDD